MNSTKPTFKKVNDKILWNGKFTDTWFSIGENFHHYLNGDLDRYRYYTQGEWDMLPTK